MAKHGHCGAGTSRPQSEAPLFEKSQTLGYPHGGTDGRLRHVVQSSWVDHDMMIERLRQAFALAEQRSEQEQQMLADLLLAEMQAEEQWEALFADPWSDTLLERMVVETLAEYEAGETEEITGDIQ